MIGLLLRSIGLLIVLMSVDVVALAGVPTYRVVAFAGSIGSGVVQGQSALNVSRWPAVHRGGDGLRFRIGDHGMVFGTIEDDSFSSSEDTNAVWSLRGARWQLGDASSRSILPFPQGAIGTVLCDANEDGSIVGGAIFSTDAVISVRAAAWSYMDGTYAGSPFIDMPIAPGGFGDCFTVDPDSLLTAVGPRDTSPARVAIVAGIASVVHSGGWSDGFTASLTRNGQFDNVERFPDTVDATWCDSWSALPPQRSSFGQCISWSGSHVPFHWYDCSVIGSIRETTDGASAHCLDTQFWDFCRWSTTSQQVLIEHCRGCIDKHHLPCVQQDPDSLTYSTVTDLRIGGFTAASIEGAPAAFSGIIEVRTEQDGAQICSSVECPHSHAAVVTASLPPSESAVKLWDLHSVLPSDMPEAPIESGIARMRSLNYQTGPDLQEESRWVAVGATGGGFRAGESGGEKSGCIWLGRQATGGGTEWCAWDVNQISIRPEGLFVDALHDIDGTGLAVGVATEIQGNVAVKKLVFLTAPADLNGDLTVGGADLGLLLGAWGRVPPDATVRFDLNQDGSITGADLGLLLGSWGGYGPGGLAHVQLACGNQPWRSPLQRFPYISQASELLGFQSLDQLGETARLLSPTGQTNLGAVIDLLADSLEEQP